MLQELNIVFCDGKKKRGHCIIQDNVIFLGSIGADEGEERGWE
jgi:hypothetical protein